jgi:hypothetical protein
MINDAFLPITGRTYLRSLLHNQAELHQFPAGAIYPANDGAGSFLAGPHSGEAKEFTCRNQGMNQLS